MYKQKWSASILQKAMYAEYGDFKSIFGSEKYLEFVDIKCFRNYFVKLVKLCLRSLTLNSCAFNSFVSL